MGLAICRLLLSGCGPERECDSHFVTYPLDSTDGVCTDEPGVYRYCESSGGGQFSTRAATTRWVYQTCPGVEPVCQPSSRAGDDGHVCHDAFEGEPCEVVEVLGEASNSGLRRRNEVRLADVDGDGGVDMVVLAERAEAYDLTLWLRLRQADGGWTDPLLVAEYDKLVYHLLIGQIDGDGWQDITVRKGTETEVTLLFPEAPAQHATASVPVESLADLDGDGVDEAFVDLDTEVEIHRQLLAPEHDVDVDVVETGTDAWGGLRVTDIDADGDRDLVIGDPYARSLLAASEGTFEPVWTGTALIDDLDGNGLVDSLSGDVVHLDVAADSPGPAVPFEQTAYWYRGRRSSGDVDGDGNLDVVETLGRPSHRDPQNGRVSVYLGDGSGQLSEPVVFDVPGYVEAIALEDLDGDGTADLVLMDREGRVFYAPSTCQSR